RPRLDSPRVRRREFAGRSDGTCGARTRRSFKWTGNRVFAPFGKNHSGARADMAAAGWAGGGRTDFARRNYARQGPTTAAILHPAGIGHHARILTPAVLGLDLGSDSR